jgi:hypothetical protein
MIDSSCGFGAWKTTKVVTYHSTGADPQPKGWGE